MNAFTANQIILLPCVQATLQDDGTYWVGIDAGETVVEGVVSADTLTDRGDRYYVRGAVTGVRKRTVRVWVPGAFGGGNGEITMALDWVSENALEDTPQSPLGGEFDVPGRSRKLPPYWGYGWFHKS